MSHLNLEGADSAQPDGSPEPPAPLHSSTQREASGGTPQRLDGSNPESRRLKDSAPAPVGGPAEWWRVHYWLYAAGGGMTPTWMGLAATSADDAIAKVQAAQNRRDAALGRAKCGYFEGATAELLPVESSR